MRRVFDLGFHSFTIDDDDHDALWLAVLNDFRQIGAHALKCAVIDCDGYFETKLSSIG